MALLSRSNAYRYFYITYRNISSNVFLLSFPVLLYPLHLKAKAVGGWGGVLRLIWTGDWLSEDEVRGRGRAGARALGFLGPGSSINAR